MGTHLRIKVFLVDDHFMVRQGLRSLLESYPDLDIVGEASEKVQPSVVVMDINMPTMDGIATTRLVKNQHPHITVVGLSINAQGHEATAMVEAGAVEVLTKEKAVEDLYRSIKKAIRHDPYAI